MLLKCSIVLLLMLRLSPSLLMPDVSRGHREIILSTLYSHVTATKSWPSFLLAGVSLISRNSSEFSPRNMTFLYHSFSLMEVRCFHNHNAQVMNTRVAYLVAKGKWDWKVTLLAAAKYWKLYFDLPFSSDTCYVNVSAVVGVDAQLDESSVDDVIQSEDRIVSQWREISADEQHELRERVDEIFRPLGYETSLVVIRRANSIALYFICMTLSALMSLRDQWRIGQLRDIINSLFTFLAGTTVYAKRLIWPVTDYERCLQFFSSVKSKPCI